jgi:hypothetical protein
MRKKKILLIGLAVTSLIAICAIGIFMFKPNILPGWLMFGKEDVASSAHAKVEEEAQLSEHAPKEHESTEKSKESSTEHPTNEASEGGHGPTAKTGSDTTVELVAATDYRAPSSKMSAVVKAMREVSAFQTQMAKGNKEAPVALKKAMLELPALFASLDVSQLAPAEVQAAALYVLSGGDPAVAHRLDKSSTLSTAQHSLLKGVESYATADLAGASEQLLHLSPGQFESMLNAQLTMAQVQLDTSSQVNVAIMRLAAAANIAPGTLIEEAAIRRIIPHLASIGDAQGYAYWAQRYLRRFPNSLYYRDFEVSFVNAALVLSAKKLNVDESDFAAIFRTAGDSKASYLAQQILLRFVKSGNIDGCTLVENSLEKNSSFENDKFKESAVLIKICNVIELDEKSISELKLLGDSELDGAVKQLLVKAVTMAETIQSGAPAHDEIQFGPHLPLSQDENFGQLFASVAQQMDSSVSVTQRVDENANNIDK